MPKQGIKESYTSISLPKSIMKKVKERIKNNPLYRSQAEFVRDAIREKMDRENSIGKDEIRKKDLLPAAWDAWTDFMIRVAGGKSSNFHQDVVLKKETSGEIDDTLKNSEQLHDFEGYLKELIKKELGKEKKRNKQRKSD